MIQGLFETHINVTNLEDSIKFYNEVLGLEVGRVELTGRRAAFLWIGDWGEAMLGLWEKPAIQVLPQHFAFRSTVEDVRSKSVSYLKDRSLPCRNFLDDGTEVPMVFAWMPAISIYFNDPDGHSLEFIAMLPGKPRPELGTIVSWERWEEINNAP